MMLSKFQEWSEGGLWGYVVVVSAFMIQVFAFGTSQSIGVYNVEFLDYFQNSAAAISLVGSINVGIFLGAGPITGFLLNYLSHRQVALIGACISSVGLICLPFTPNVEYMYFFYGFLTGWLMDMTGGLTPGFLFAGLVTVFGGILVSLIPLQHRLCPSKDSTTGNRVEIDLKEV